MPGSFSGRPTGSRRPHPHLVPSVEQVKHPIELRQAVASRLHRSRTGTWRRSGPHRRRIARSACRSASPSASPCHAAASSARHRPTAPRPVRPTRSSDLHSTRARWPAGQGAAEQRRQGVVGTGAGQVVEADFGHSVSKLIRHQSDRAAGRRTPRHPFGIVGASLLVQAMPAMSRCAHGLPLTKRSMNCAAVNRAARAAAADVFHVGDFRFQRLVVFSRHRHPPQLSRPWRVPPR